MDERQARLASKRAQIAALVADYHAEAFAPGEFVPGETPVPVSGKVFGAEELQHAVDASLDFWLTTGRFAAQFERRFASRMSARYALLVNSGSSANLLAVSALTSPLLGERRLVPGDEVLTVAAGFPTTVNPILQNGLIPGFVDVSLPDYGVTVETLAAALGPRTKAIILAHTLGNPYDAEGIAAFAEKHGLWFIEDCCDAVGATINGRSVGTFGHLATVSFYPAHHITMGEGGVVLAHHPLHKRILESLRDWGRDCWCEPGKDNSCGKRFGHQLGELPAGYDHKYTYSHIGYNLKATDFQAAVGLAQLDRLDGFIAARRRNYAFLRDALAKHESLFEFVAVLPGAEPSWFGFAMRVRESAPFDRNALVAFLESRLIATRLLFGGNLLRQPAYQGAPMRLAGPLDHADQVMRGTFWVGCHPGLTQPMLQWIVDSVEAFVGGARA